MTGWTRNDLERIGAAEELRLATFKKDGTLGNPVIIWVVRVGDDLSDPGAGAPAPGFATYNGGTRDAS